MTDVGRSRPGQVVRAAGELGSTTGRRRLCRWPEAVQRRRRMALRATPDSNEPMATPIAT